MVVPDSESEVSERTCVGKVNIFAWKKSEEGCRMSLVTVFGLLGSGSVGRYKQIGTAEQHWNYIIGDNFKVVSIAVSALHHIAVLHPHKPVFTLSLSLPSSSKPSQPVGCILGWLSGSPGWSSCSEQLGLGKTFGSSGVWLLAQDFDAQS